MLRKTSRFLLILLAAMTALAFSSCSNQQKKVLLQSYGLDYVSPTSLRSISLGGHVVVENMRKSFSVEKISGTIYHGKESLCTITADDLFIYGQCTQSYDIKIKLNLEDGIGLVEMSRLLMNFNPEDFDISINAKLVSKKDPSKKGGFTVTVRKQHIPMSDLLSKDYIEDNLIKL